MANATLRSFEFGPYRLDPAKRLLSRNGRSLALPPKTFDLLLLLVEGRGRVLTKKELMSLLWSDTIVEEANLSFQISALRKVLDEDGTEWIETLPRYGYRFKGEVSEVDLSPRSDIDVPLVPDKREPVGTNGPTVARSEGEQKAAAQEPVLVPTPSSVFRRAFYFVPAALASFVAIFFAVMYLRQTQPRERVVRFQIPPPEGVIISDIDSISMSPDGERLMFIGIGPDSKRLLWVRSLGSVAPEQVAGTEFVDAAFWSPDGRSVAFFALGKLKRFDFQTGEAQTICQTPVGRSSGTWNRNGVILFETAKHPLIYRVAAAGGAPIPVDELNVGRGEIHQSDPQFLPDGVHFIYFSQSEHPEDTGIYVASLGSKNSKRLVNSLTNAVYAGLRRGNYLLFTRGSDLIAQSFDFGKWELVGPPIRVAQRILIENTGGFARALITASENGILAYRTRVDAGSDELVWFDRQGRRLGTLGEPADYSNPALSPDEKKLIVSRADPQTRTKDLWLFDLVSGGSSRFTFSPDDEDLAAWSPDGKRVVFNVVHSGVRRIYQKAITGASERELLLRSEEDKVIRSWSPDGRFLLLGAGPQSWILPMDGTGKLNGPYDMESPRVSPNGRWAAYTLGDTGRSEVYVCSFPKPDGKWQISTTGGTEPSWRGDGKELFYISANKLIAVDVKTDSPTFQSGVAKPLFELNLDTSSRHHYQITANGQRILANVRMESSSPITVAINWEP
jgi:eukaryotic-like serine/threonine-protein kinase